MTDREGGKDSQPSTSCSWRKDWTGYQNLCRIVTDAHLDGYYYKPRIDREHLARHSEGLIGLSACLGGEIARALEIEDWDSARKLAGQYKDIFGPGDFFLELQDHGIPEQRALNPKLLRLAPEVGLPLVATNDLHYVHREQHEAHDALLCVGTGSALSDPKRLPHRRRGALPQVRGPDGGALPGPARGHRQHPAHRRDDRPAASSSGSCGCPHFPVPDGHTVESWLREECQRGLEQRYGTVTDELQRASTTSSTSSSGWATRATSSSSRTSSASPGTSASRPPAAARRPAAS